MRILTVTHFFESHGGGIERVAGQLCRQFEQLGEEPIWAASDSDARPDDLRTVPLSCVNPIERLTGLPMPLPLPSAIRMLAREVGRSDAVIIHDALYVTSIVALLIAKAQRKRVILIQHISQIAFASPILRVIMKCANLVVTQPMLRSANACIFISDTVRSDLVGQPARIASTLLFNGVDNSIFHRPEKSQSSPSGLTDICVAPGSKRVLFVGRYVEKKGLGVIRALAEMSPNLSFFLVGSGPIAPGEWRLPNVHDLGAQSQDAVADLYRWADVLLLPSVGEGYPLVIQEAMACGLPVVCGEPSNRADPGAAEWLKGVRVDLADPNRSAERLASVLTTFDPSNEDRAAMSNYALRHYDWTRMARGVLALAGGSGHETVA